MEINEYMNRINSAVNYAKNSSCCVTAYNWNESLKEKNVVAFGLGKFFHDTHERLFRLIQIESVCDNDSSKWGKEFYGKTCIRPVDLESIKDVFVIVVMGDPREVVKQLSSKGIPSISISELYFSNYVKGRSCDWLEAAMPDIEKTLTLFDDEKSREIFTNVFCNKIYLSNADVKYEQFASVGEYFETGIWTLGDEEYFVDGGAFVGDTVRDFVNHTHGKFGAVYSFEYEAGNYANLCKNVNSYSKEISEKIMTFPYGIWDKHEESWCEAFGESDGTQLVTEENKSTNAQVCILDKLDDVLAGRKVTTLKLDIEGAEIQGLNGALKIITEQKPKLAICLYHRPEDLWEIPLLIHKMRPDYKMSIRHHCYQDYRDTVLYAF